MIEIIEMILNREGETTLVSNLQQRQYSAKVTHTQNFQELSTNAMIRSQKTYDAIRGLSITMKLNLAASKIK